MRSGFTAARGEYFIKFDDDDGLTPEFLAKTVPILDQEKNVDFVCTDHWIIDKFGQKVASATQENSAKWGKDRLQQGIITDLERQTFSYTLHGYNLHFLLKDNNVSTEPVMQNYQQLMLVKLLY